MTAKWPVGLSCWWRDINNEVAWDWSLHLKWAENWDNRGGLWGQMLVLCHPQIYRISLCLQKSSPKFYVQWFTRPYRALSKCSVYVSYISREWSNQCWPQEHNTNKNNNQLIKWLILCIVTPAIELFHGRLSFPLKMSSKIFQ